jgi:hypothetical protein
MRTRQLLSPAKTIALICLACILQVKKTYAQIILDEEPKRLYYHLTKRVKRFRDMKNFRDVFHYDHYLLGKNRISGNISYNTGRVQIDDGRTIHQEWRQAVGFFTRIRFLEEFSFNTTFYVDFNKRATMARWIPDYTYSIGRYNWRSRRVNFGYENYTNNRYSDNFRTFRNKFLEGYYFLAYNYFPVKLNKLVKIDSTTGIRLTGFTRYSVTYRDEFEVTRGGLFSGKPQAGISCRYTIAMNIYVESALYFYDNSKKQPWDPDFTYGFGYFDWRSFRVCVTYGNWAINRFPWNKKYYGRYSFLDGNFRVAFNWIW